MGPKKKRLLAYFKWNQTIIWLWLVYTHISNPQIEGVTYWSPTTMFVPTWHAAWPKQDYNMSFNLQYLEGFTVLGASHIELHELLYSVYTSTCIHSQHYEWCTLLRKLHFPLWEGEHHNVFSSWWLNQPIWKIWVKLDHFPKDRGENNKYLNFEPFSFRPFHMLQHQSWLRLKKHNPPMFFGLRSSKFRTFKRKFNKTKKHSL